jgi:hypothetical protein
MQWWPLGDVMIQRFCGVPHVFFRTKQVVFFPCVESMILILYNRISEIKGCGGLYARFQVGIYSRQRWGWLIANEHGDFTTKYLRFEWV